MTIYDNLKNKAKLTWALMTLLLFGVLVVVYFITDSALWVLGLLLLASIFLKKVWVERKRKKCLEGAYVLLENSTKYTGITTKELLSDVFFEAPVICGLGRCQGSIDVIYVTVSNKGIIFNYLLLANEPVKILSWEKINKLFVDDVEWKDNSQYSAEILLAEQDDLIILPWDKRFNHFVPELVGFEELTS